MIDTKLDCHNFLKRKNILEDHLALHWFHSGFLSLPLEYTDGEGVGLWEEYREEILEAWDNDPENKGKKPYFWFIERGIKKERRTTNEEDDLKVQPGDENLPLIGNLEMIELIKR